MARGSNRVKVGPDIPENLPEIKAMGSGGRDPNRPMSDEEVKAALAVKPQDVNIPTNVVQTTLPGGLVVTTITGVQSPKRETKEQATTRVRERVTLPNGLVVSTR